MCHNPFTHFVWRRLHRAYLMSPSSDPVATVSASTANMVSTLSGWPVPQQSLSSCCTPNCACGCVLHVCMSVEKGLYLDTYHPSLPSGPRCRRSAHLPVCLQSPSCHPVVNQSTNQHSLCGVCHKEKHGLSVHGMAHTTHTLIMARDRNSSSHWSERACNLPAARSNTLKVPSPLYTCVCIHVATSS